jgi:NAD(P)H-quinone oxidoreductase subunit 5
MEVTMTHGLAFAPLLAPLVLLTAAVLARRDGGVRPRIALAATRLAGAAALAIALATAAATAAWGPATSPLLGVGGIGISIRLDALSATMFALVAFLGAVVLRYSRTYLDGDARQGVFLGDLALTIAAVMALVLAGNLGQLVAAWVGTSLALHRLLLFHPDRPGAVIAARKKFIVARLGDACLVVAAILLWRAFGTADVATLAERTDEVLRTGAVPPLATAAALLLVVTAALKSAVFPTHGWLAEVMETPTPVSALLHAGILNGGVFLVARLAGAVALSPTALGTLVMVGGFTAFFASVVMVTQTSVKVGLAYSSAAHMGFMLLLCGLGAYPIAILHLVAHSFYKAHAFLSSGSVVDAARASWLPGDKPAPGTGRIAAGFAVAVATVVTVASLVGAAPWERPVTAGLAAILAIGLTQLLVQALVGKPEGYVLARTAAAAAAVALAFFSLELGAAHVLHAAVPTVVPTAPTTLALMTLIVAAFAAASWAQLRLPALAASPRWAAAYVHVRNGLYANACFDRLVGLPAPATAPHLATETPS